MKTKILQEEILGHSIHSADIYGQAIKQPDIYGQAIKQPDIYGQVYIDMSALQQQPSDYSLASEDISSESEAGPEFDNGLQEVVVHHQATSAEGTIYQESPYSYSYSAGPFDQLYYQQNPYLYSNPIVSGEPNVNTTNTMAPMSNSPEYATQPQHTIVDIREEFPRR